MIVLQCCGIVTSGTVVDWDGALAEAFQCQPDSELKSQMNLSRNSIVRLGREEREVFNTAVQKMFEELSEEDLTALFNVYSAVSSGFTIPKRASGATSRPPRKKRDQRTAKGWQVLGLTSL